jgi:dolichyl-phosphate beta-glucosyltransferase
MAEPSLSVVIPCYNEERRLEGTIGELLAWAGAERRTIEVVIVDDGSSDGTGALAERLAREHPEVRAVRLERNGGKGGAVRAGLLAARAPLRVFADADGSFPPEEISKLEAAAREGADVAAGSRDVDPSLSEGGPHRRLLRRFFRAVVRALAVRSVADTQCGFKLFRADAVEALFGGLRTPGYAFDVEVLARAERLGLRVAEVPVRCLHREGSKVRVVRDGLRMLRDVALVRIRLGPPGRPFSLAPLAALYLALALAFTWPAPLTLASRPLGGSTDTHQNLWNIWWMRRALETGADPWRTDMLHHPVGAGLHLHTLSPLNALAGAALAPPLPLPLAYNLLITAHLVLAGLAAAALAREVTRDRGASAFAGAAYTFSAYHVGHAGHVNLFATELLPLVLLGALRWRRGPPLRAGLATAAAIAVAGLLDWYGFLFAGAVAAAAMAWLAARDPTVRTGAHAGAAALALALPPLALSPLIVAMLAAARAPMQAGHAPADFSADLLSFLVPGHNSAWGPHFAPIWKRFSTVEFELTTFLGVATPALALLGLRRREGEDERTAAARGALAVVGALGLLLCLGPVLQVAGIRTQVSLPYAWMVEAFPPLRVAGVPIRFAILADLALAGLAAIGLARLLARWPRRRLALVSAAVALRLLEQAALPFPTTHAEVPALYRTIAADPRRTAVLDLATREEESVVLLHQTLHGHPVVGGYLARVPRDRLETLRLPVVRHLILRTRVAEVAADAPPEVAAALMNLTPEEEASERAGSTLARLGVAWVVTRNDLARALCERLGYRRVAEEGERTLFRVF